jgi:hypothetical protein
VWIGNVVIKCHLAAERLAVVTCINRTVVFADCEQFQVWAVRAKTTQQVIVRCGGELPARCNAEFTKCALCDRTDPRDLTNWPWRKPGNLFVWRNDEQTIRL